MTEAEEFELCVEDELLDDGITFRCKLGLWSVTAGRITEALPEAWHYFKQYKADGEYSDIIGGPSVIDVLNKELDTMK